MLLFQCEHERARKKQNLGKFLGNVDQLQANKLVALLLEALDDLTNDGALHAVGLDSDESAFLAGALIGVIMQPLASSFGV